MYGNDPFIGIAALAFYFTSVYFHCTFLCFFVWTIFKHFSVHKMNSCGYPHDGRADKAAYPHDCRADNASYRRDCRADKPRYWHNRNMNYNVECICETKA